MEKIKNLDEAIDLLLEQEQDIPTLLQEGGLVSQLKKKLLEAALEAEMKEHLGYEKNQPGKNSNRRNGSTSKKLITKDGLITLSTPRDRESSFEPKIIKKRQTRIPGLDQAILSFYAKGMSVSDIQKQVHELYEVDISESFISRVTDAILNEVGAWQNRPLEKVYCIVYFDCIVVKVRQEGRIINKAVYLALGLPKSGKKELLGMWISENEGAKFWLGVLTEIKNRGVEDILISCTDNLQGLSEAITSAYPQSTHQLCIVHQIRNSLKYVSYKDRKQVANDLKPIYRAVNESEATLSLETFEEKWGKKYPQIGKSWHLNWANLVSFLEYPAEIRRLIYTTNPIESLNSCLRKVTKNKRVFPSDESVFKSLYLSIRYLEKKWTMPVRNWNESMGHFFIKFEGRI